MALLLRIFYALLYHRFAWCYDWVANLVSCWMWQSWVGACLPYLNGPCVLELGCGPGHLQTALQQKGLLAYGVDASKEMTRLARRNLQRRGLELRLLQGYAQSLGFKSSFCDQVVATFPTSYIVHSKSLGEIYRVLKPQGQLVILLGAIPSGTRFCQRVAAWLFRITRQAQEVDESSILKPFHQANFEARLLKISSTNSQLYFILASKKL